MWLVFYSGVFHHGNHLASCFFHSECTFLGCFLSPKSRDFFFSFYKLLENLTWHLQLFGHIEDFAMSPREIALFHSHRAHPLPKPSFILAPCGSLMILPQCITRDYESENLIFGVRKADFASPTPMISILQLGSQNLKHTTGFNGVSSGRLRSFCVSIQWLSSLLVAITGCWHWLDQILAAQERGWRCSPKSQPNQSISVMGWRNVSD